MTYTFYYVNGKTKVKSFKTPQEAAWFMFNEGDHVLKMEPLEESS